MVVAKLEAALSAIDWNKNVTEFLSSDKAKERIAACNFRLAVWARQFEQSDKSNPALCFIREMQSAGQQVSALTALALYKPAASAMRTVIETALYYTYFRTHPAELSTLVLEKDFYITKEDVLDFHRVHTRDFKFLQEKLGLVSKLNGWYKDISAIVHGQLPGVWTLRAQLANLCHEEKTMMDVVDKFSTGIDITNRLFLCTVGRELWDDFSSTAKSYLLKGLSGETKTYLKLDSA